MAIPRIFLQCLIFIESIFLYWAVTRLRYTAQKCNQVRPGDSQVIPYSTLPTIYIVTPTYTRPTQLADLTRLANTLRLVPNVHWLVSEDSNSITIAVTELLESSGLSYTQMAASRPEEMIGKVIGRGVFNRRAAISWIRNHGSDDGIIYFADDDNSYDVRIFEEIRQTRGVSVFPVGLILKYGVSSPIVREGKVIGFFDAFQAGRQFAMDMAGFSVSVRLLKARPEATFPAQVSYLEEGFVQSLEVKKEDLEPRAEQCTRVWVWHTRTERASTPKLDHIREGGWTDTNLPKLYSGLHAS